jgi:hypothetical protein
VASEKLGPDPIEPSRSDDQARLAVTSPSSASLAEARKETGSPSVDEEPFAGSESVTTGRTFASTVTVIAAEPGVPCPFVAVAVIVWTPWERPEVENPPPLPIAPSRSESQTSAAVRSPSSASLAVPAKPSRSPSVMLVPSAGRLIATVGVTGVNST